MFLSALLLVLLIVVSIFLFKFKVDKLFWKEEKLRFEVENKKLDLEIQRYHSQVDSLLGVVSDRYNEIRKRDSLINVSKQDLVKVRRKYEKMYQTVDSLSAISTLNFFSSYTDTIEIYNDCP